MDHLNYTSFDEPRKRGQHLRFEDRCMIKTLHKLGYSNRKIAKELNCSPSTVGYELRRGTARKKTNIGRPTTYSPNRGQAIYKSNKQRCGRKTKLARTSPFLKWVVAKVRNDGWSLDACAGYAASNNLFSGDITCCKTLYNSLHSGLLGISLFDVPEVLSRRRHKHNTAKNKRVFGRSIDARPESASNGSEFGHWEIDTVIGKKTKEPVVLTLVEKLTHNYIAIKINGKDAASVETGMAQLRDLYGSRFTQVFKTITADNGSEFAELAELSKNGNVYYAHPYSSWERPQNERHNRIFRQYVPKSRSIDNFTADQILWFADEMNSIPRKSLGYMTPEQLFEQHLDEIYAT